MNLHFFKEKKTYFFIKKPGFYLSLGLIIFLGSLILFFNCFVGFLFPGETKPDISPNLETLKFSAYIIGGLLLIWQIYLTNRRTKATEKTAEASAKTALSTIDNIRILEKGQIQERFKNAIDQLGNNSEAVNLGAIYTLHHISKDSNELKKSVFDILCSYLRETTTTLEYKGRNDTSIKIQSILNLLLVDEEERAIYKDFKADMHSASLILANLSKAALSKINFTKANLTKANLNKADLSESYLDEAILDEAMLRGANLSSASLFKTNLHLARLSRSNLSKADLSMANLSGANLINSNLTNADLSNANLTGANLLQSDLSEADLSWANLSKARLSRANLSKAKLTLAVLIDANLNTTNLSEADLSGADLTSANLKNANLTNSLIIGSIVTPDWIKKVKSWNCKGLEEIEIIYDVIEREDEKKNRIWIIDKKNNEDQNIHSNQ